MEAARVFELFQITRREGEVCLHRTVVNAVSPEKAALRDLRLRAGHELVAAFVRASLPPQAQRTERMLTIPFSVFEREAEANTLREHESIPADGERPAHFDALIERLESGGTFAAVWEELTAEAAA